jgi:lysyl-tRNA synthetase class 2
MPSDLIRFHENDHRLYRNVQARARLLALLREFFAGRGFLEVETPVVCTSPGVETHLAAMPVEVGRRTMYLTTSPEFHMKRMVAAGFDRVWQLTRAFRGGEVGARHNPEFAMIEFYRRGDDYGAIMDDLEAMLAHLATGLHGRAWAPEVPGVRPAIPLAPPWRRVRFADAFAEAGEPDPLTLAREDRIEVLAERVEPRLGVDRPEFLVDYPADQASLARASDQDPRWAERFELYAGGMELANGWTEVADADEYLRRCDDDLAERRSLGLPEYPVDDRYVSMLREGMPDCAGVAVGFDRVVMLMTGATRIQDVIAFPIDVA